MAGVHGITASVTKVEMSSRLFIALVALTCSACSDPAGTAIQPLLPEGHYRQITVGGRPVPGQYRQFQIDSGSAVIHIGGYGSRVPDDRVLEMRSFGRDLNFSCACPADFGCYGAVWIITASAMRGDTIHLNLSKWVSPGILTPATKNDGAFIFRDTITYFDPNGMRQFVRVD